VTDESILQGVRHVLHAHVGVKGDVSPEMHLLRDLRLDSVGQLTLVVELESYFHIAFDDADAQGVETVRDLVTLVSQHLHDPNLSEPRG
jgi:acyl carrier protein